MKIIYSILTKIGFKVRVVRTELFHLRVVGSPTRFIQNSPVLYKTHDSDSFNLVTIYGNILLNYKIK